MNEDFRPLKPHMKMSVLNKLNDLKGEILTHRRKKNNPLRRLIPGNVERHKTKEQEKLKKFQYARRSLENTLQGDLKRSHARSALLKAGIESLEKKLPKNNIRRFNREDIEYLIDYLLDEGYVNNEKSALKIIECMSEEWIYDILEEV